MKRSRLRSVSPRKKAQLEEYFPRARAFKKRHPVCQVCDRRKTKDVHHKAGRLGKNLLDEATWLAVCRQCHDRVHMNPSWARAQGFLV